MSGVVVVAVSTAVMTTNDSFYMSVLVLSIIMLL